MNKYDEHEQTGGEKKNAINSLTKLSVNPLLSLLSISFSLASRAFSLTLRMC